MRRNRSKGKKEGGREVRFVVDNKKRKNVDKQKKREEKVFKVAFWNVAGLLGKDRKFCERIKDWNVIVVSETWIDERGWEKIKDRIPKGYNWKVQFAGKKNRKGGAMGGMIMGVRIDIKMEKEEEVIEREGLVTGKIWLGGWWRIIGVYVNKDLESKLEMLREWIEEKEERVRVVIGGDFNARTGRQSGRVDEIEGGCEERRDRKSRDTKVNGEGRKLHSFLEERGWAILKGGEEGEWTYIRGKGQSGVIDYIMDERVREKIERMEVESRVDSDHQRYG